MALSTLVSALASRLHRGRVASTPPTTPEPPIAVPAPALMTQDLLEHSTRVAQCLYNCKTVAAGQIVTIEGYRRMVITVHDNRITLVPDASEGTASSTPTTPVMEDAALMERDTMS